MSTSAIGEHFERTCRERETRTAILWLPEARVITFGALHEQYLALRSAFRRLDVGRGACVVSLVGNQPMFFPLLAACMDAGVALLPVGEATEAEALSIVANAGATAVVSSRLLPLAGTDRVSLDEATTLLRMKDPQPSGQYGEAVLAKLTSGSTDLPKLTLASEQAVIADGSSIAAAMSVAPDDVNLAVIPLSHAYAIGNIVMPLILQGTMTALRPSFNPASFLRDAKDSGATIFPGVPFVFDHLRAIVDRDNWPKALRLLITAGARIDPATVGWFHTRVGRKIHSFYGTTETGGITFDDTDVLHEPLHLGRPLPGVSVEIEREIDSTSGRVFVKSGSVATGYANASDEERAAFQRGGFRTGDLGYVDDCGQLVLTGRASSLVNVAGRKVDPAEVERVLMALAEVEDARVVGVESERRGEELIAFVLRADLSVTALDLRRRCADTLSPYKIPRRFIFLDRWPVDDRGKVDRRTLTALAAEG